MAVVLVVRLVVNSTSMKLTYVSRSTCVNENESELERGVRLGWFDGHASCNPIHYPGSLNLAPRLAVSDGKSPLIR